MRIFGKTTEPSMVIAVIVAVVSLGGTLGFTVLSADQAGLWIVVVNAVGGVAMGLTTRPISPGIFTYLIGALVALGAAYGLSLTPEQVNGINGLVIPILALLTRGQVSPTETVLTKHTEAVGKPEVQTVPDGGK